MKSDIITIQRILAKDVDGKIHQAYFTNDNPEEDGDVLDMVSVGCPLSMQNASDTYDGKPLYYTKMNSWPRAHVVAIGWEMPIEEGVDVEKAVEEVVDDYGAPENITDEIKNFLFNSDNLYTIIDIIEEAHEITLYKELKGLRDTLKDWYSGDGISLSVKNRIAKAIVKITNTLGER